MTVHLCRSNELHAHGSDGDLGMRPVGINDRARLCRVRYCDENEYSAQHAWPSTLLGMNQVLEYSLNMTINFEFSLSRLSCTSRFVLVPKSRILQCS